MKFTLEMGYKITFKHKNNVKKIQKQRHSESNITEGIILIHSYDGEYL